MSDQKCYNCGITLSEVQMKENLAVTMKNKTYPVCSERCKRACSSFLSLLMTEG